ncbi:MAG: ASCH domain-containing protein [Bacilli bacterium]|nr:ASCH domain-containing protein [Bacilli bacterium]
MKVITIRQPWASLIVNGYKEYEFRSWKTKHRGELLIHAGKGFNKQEILKFKELNLDFPTGCIIGKVILEDCLEVDSVLEEKLIKQNILVYGSINRSGYAWKVSNPQQIDKIYINGKLSLWDYKR